VQNPEKKPLNHRFLLSLTSLTADEFFAVLYHFDQCWQSYHRHTDLQGKDRRIEKFSEDSRISLEGSSEKLLFVLIYLKQNPLQYYQGLAFNISQGKVSQWLKILRPILEQALERMSLMPARTPARLLPTLKLLAAQVIYMDATERPVPRSVDWERQKHEYSGKRGYHTVKNLVVSDEQGKVLYLSPTVAGSMHDKALADEMELVFEPDQGLLLDSGFQGYKPDQAQVCLPVKKPMNGQLTDYDKMYNKLLATLRVKVEHVMAGIKRLKIVKDTIRLKNEQVRDKVMLIAVALHNLRIAYRNLS
jgi:hypothetical protein